ncbi:MAG: DNA/RNA nuclease SfsA [Thermofilaceae archaeon]|nr:DNA/RNA nuclease SfsA [Thermofilaceae archaeon]MCX8180262.1 DNA/RNA nuclease SfsA [Thermofilaceae archaeon]MDW8004018.1 DNA/RNA nuclease SfsA [Thermofilaceae archaeon]
MPSELIRLPVATECKIVRRVNRFAVEVSVDNTVEKAYINNTGRLIELLVSGRKCYCMPKKEGATRLRLIAIEERGAAALIDTSLQSKAFEKALEEKLLPWAPCLVVARNPRLGSSVLDYLLECGKEVMYVELKSAVLRDGDYAAYPDCPTQRGRRHIRELVKLVESGGKGTIVFIAALPGVRAFKPYVEGDPVIPALLKEAYMKGVEVHAISMHYNPVTSTVFLDDPDLPVMLT